MKEHAASAVYREKVRLCLQCNYKQLRLNFVTINELRIRDFRGVGGGASRKLMEIPGGGGSTVKPPGTENPGGLRVELEKNPPWGGYEYFLEAHN